MFSLSSRCQGAPVSLQNRIENTELNDLRKVVCLRKSEISFERISVCNLIENILMGKGLNKLGGGAGRGGFNYIKNVMFSARETRLLPVYVLAI